MTLPDNARCAEVMRELDGEPMLSEFENSFVKSNLTRTEFSTKQKEVVARLLEKYEV